MNDVLQTIGILGGFILTIVAVVWQGSAQVQRQKDFEKIMAERLDGISKNFTWLRDLVSKKLFGVGGGDHTEDNE